MKQLTTLSLLIFLFTVSSAQNRRKTDCYTHLRNSDYDLAIDCFQRYIDLDKPNCGKDCEALNFYAGVLYYKISTDDAKWVNQLDTNTIDKSILYFYTSLLYNMKGYSCQYLDYKKDKDKSIIIDLFNNSKPELWDDHHKFDIFDYYLPEIESYVKDHKISEESMKILEILRTVKK